MGAFWAQPLFMHCLLHMCVQSARAALSRSTATDCALASRGFNKDNTFLGRDCTRHA